MTQTRDAGTPERGLTARDLVTTGIFTALYLVFMMVGGMPFAPNPLLTFWMPAAVALLTGPVYLLLIAKVPKHGPLVVLGVVEGLILFVTGMYWGWAVACVLLGVVADIVASIGRFRSKALNLLAFVVYSLSPMGSYLMLWLDPEAYGSYLVGRATDPESVKTLTVYMDTMRSAATDWMLPAMILAAVVCAVASGLLGLRLLRRQFEKAGVTA